MPSRRAPQSPGKRRAEPLGPHELELALASLRARLHAEGAVKVSSILPKAAKDEIVARLAEEGHERAGVWLRRPVREQMRDALRHGAALPKKSLSSLVRGCSVAELARVASEMERAGELHRVLRGKNEVFTGAESEVLTPPSLAALKPVIARLYQALAAVSRKKGMTLLASDVDELLAGAHGSLQRSVARRSVVPLTQPVAMGSSAAASGPLLDALDATRDARTGLSFVPRLVERLLPGVSLAVAHEMLLEAARDERIELRPEGGLARLTSDELGLCPAGPGGMRLSWARRLDGAP